MDCLFHEVAKSRTRLSDFHTERSMTGFKAGGCHIPICLFMAALLWVFVAVPVLQLPWAGAAVSLCCAGFSFQWFLLLRSTAVGTWVSVVWGSALVALWRNSQPRDWTTLPCIGRWILTTRPSEKSSYLCFKLEYSQGSFSHVGCFGGRRGWTLRVFLNVQQRGVWCSG